MHGAVTITKRNTIHNKSIIGGKHNETIKAIYL